MHSVGLVRTIGLVSMAYTKLAQGQPALMSKRADNQTADSAELKTWWHNSGEVNVKTPVQDGNVRQSHIYSISVGVASDASNWYNSFVYESIPRNGNGKICTPGDTTPCDTDDQITIESDIGVDMAWTQYLTSVDTIVRVTRADGGSVGPDNVVIRPTNVAYDLKAENDALVISVPYSENGHRFSVEFKDNLWEYRNAAKGTNSHYVQNKNSDGVNYVSEYDDSMPVVGVEPLNALLIFVSPFPDTQLVPDLENDVYEVAEGLVGDLTQVTQSTLYFPPGVYWCTGTDRAILSSSVTWVYLAPGAYVKGAIEYHSQDLDLRATGFGVLSGEQYVYQANTANGYINEKSDDTSLKMWRGQSAAGMRWTLHGLTMNAPPFNSMDFYGADLSSFSIDASDYKQVGAFFGQTDGIQMYPGSHVRDIFYHVGDDGIKTYYSNVLCERTIVWKTSNAPIVQFGWYPRDSSNVTVDSVDVIHTRYSTQQDLYPRALVGSARSYEDVESTTTADITKHVSSYNVTNWRCEGICPALLGINPLQNIDSMIFSNIQIEQLSGSGTEVGQSMFYVFTDEKNGDQAVALGDNSTENFGLVIENFYVGGEHITFEADNWDASSLGQLNIDGHWEGRWTVR